MSYYRKWTAEDDKMRNVFPDGEYHALIVDIIEKMTKGGKFDKAGKPIPQMKMAELDLLIADQDGRERKMKDWILLEGDMSWKFRHLCDACGKLDEYEADDIQLRSLINKVPVVLVKSKKMLDQHGNEVTRNTIVDYLKPKLQPEADNFLDDDIPSFKS